MKNLVMKNQSMVHSHVILLKQAMGVVDAKYLVGLVWILSEYHYLKCTKYSLVRGAVALPAPMSPPSTENNIQ